VISDPWVPKNLPAPTAVSDYRNIADAFTSVLHYG